MAFITCIRENKGERSSMEAEATQRFIINDGVPELHVMHGNVTTVIVPPMYLFHRDNS